MNKKIIIAISVLIAILFVSAIAGTIVYYNGVVNDKNSHIASLNNQMGNLNSQISNLTAQVSLLTNMTRTNRSLISAEQNPQLYLYVGEGSYGDGWNWTIILELENIGNTPVTINNMDINGQPYSSYNPVPTINPSIKNGYTLSPNQSVTITIQVINQPLALYQGTNELYVLTTMGNSLEVYLGS